MKMNNRVVLLQVAGYLPRPEDGQGDGALPGVRARRPGPQPLHREVPSSRLGPREDKGHYVADFVRG